MLKFMLHTIAIYNFKKTFSICWRVGYTISIVTLQVKDVNLAGELDIIKAIICLQVKVIHKVFIIQVMNQ